MRSSRLVALLAELTRVRRTTVGALAAAHGVSERTIQRDLLALEEIGAPVWTRTGPGGGVGLVDGWRSPLTGMTPPELQALLLGEAGARDLGLEGELATARVKMLSTRTPGVDVGESTMQRFHVDHGHWFSGPERPACLPDVARGVWAGCRLRLRYRRPGQDPEVVTRLVDPLGLVLKADRWYLVAAHRRSVRTYRVSRVVDAHVTDEQGWRPEGFDLAEYWARSRAEFEGGVFTYPVRLTVPESSLDALRAALRGVDIDGPLARAREGVPADESGDDPAPERVELALRAEKFDIVSHQLLGVPGVGVLEPEELRTALAERGRDLLRWN